jgi:adenosine deaminase
MAAAQGVGAEATALRSLDTLPKAHLHLHLEGAMRRATLLDLCAEHGIETPANTQGMR